MMNFKIFSLESLFIKGVGIIIVANNNLNKNQLQHYQKVFNALPINNSTLTVPQKISSSVSSLSSNSPKLSSLRVKTIKPIGIIDRNNHAKPIETSTKPLFNTLDDINTAFSLLRNHLKKFRETNAQEEYTIASEVTSEVRNPRRISAYYNPSENRVVVSNYSYSQIRFIEGSSTHPFFVLAGRPPASYTYADGHAYDYIRETVGNVKPKFTTNLTYKVKSLFSTISHKPQSKLLASRFLRDENLIVDISELVTGRPLTEYGNNWVPVLFSAGEPAMIIPERSLHSSFPKKNSVPLLYHIDFHLFEALKISNGLGTELFSIKNNFLLTENYNKHFLKNPNYRVGNRIKPLISTPLYNDVSEIEALAKEAQKLDYSASNGRFLFYDNGLIISGVLSYNPNDLNYPFLYVLRGSNLERLLEHTHTRGKNATLNGYTILTLPQNFDQIHNPALGIKLAKFDKYSIYGGNSKFFTFSQEWKLDSFQKTYNSNSEEYKRIFPAFVEYKTDHLKNTEFKSLVFPLFENLYALSAENQQRLHLSVRTFKDFTISNISKVILYESLTPPHMNISVATTYSPEMQIKFILNNLSAKNIKGVVSLIPQFIDKDEMTIFSEHIYYTFNGGYVFYDSFVKIAPVALYHPGDHSIAILDNSILAMAYRRFSALRANYPRDFQFIRFSSNITPANITIFSKDNFLKLIHTPTLLALEESSYNTANTIFLNPDKWNVLYTTVSNPYPVNTNNPILIGLFKNITLLGNKFSQKIKLFGRELFYELLIEYSPYRNITQLLTA